MQRRVRVMATGAERLMQTVQAAARKPKFRVICGFFGPVRDWVSCYKKILQKRITAIISIISITTTVICDLNTGGTCTFILIYRTEINYLNLPKNLLFKQL